ncbi:hypothetical protein PR048_022040 [Dryococelus australis]|uniref:Uncharacterized protein n=1 Tax=Dryococelus australis TaxID=614101 RepID=A0ABQ9GZZ4_9NEOP|nr:hypothetical protein PR048_022040 [Dryococelus australis]
MSPKRKEVMRLIAQEKLAEEQVKMQWMWLLWWAIANDDAFCFELASHQGDPVSLPGRVTPDFRMWESCRTMPLVGGSSRRSPVSPALSFRRCFILVSITLIGSQDLDVTSHPDLRRNERARKREILENTCQPASLFVRIPTCEYPGATPPRIEPGSPRWEAILNRSDHTRCRFVLGACEASQTNTIWYGGVSQCADSYKYQQVVTSRRDELTSELYTTYSTVKSDRALTPSRLNSSAALLYPSPGMYGVLRGEDNCSVLASSHPESHIR